MYRLIYSSFFISLFFFGCGEKGLPDSSPKPNLKKTTPSSTSDKKVLPVIKKEAKEKYSGIYPKFKATKINSISELEFKLKIKLTKHQTAHFILYSQWSDETNLEFLKLWEETLKEFCTYWEIPPQQVFGDQPCQFFLFNSSNTYIHYIEKSAMMEEPLSNKKRDFYLRMKKSKGYRLGLNYISFVKPGELKTEIRNKTLNILGIQMLSGLTKNTLALPAWLTYGYRSYWMLKKIKKSEFFQLDISIFANDFNIPPAPYLKTGKIF